MKVGQKVIHKNLGEGTIIAIDNVQHFDKTWDTYLTIDMAGKNRCFTPESIKPFLVK